MEIAVTFVVDANVEGWAQARKIAVDEAAKEIFEYLASAARSGLMGQSFLTCDSVAVIEN